MADQARPKRMSCAARALLVAIGVAAGAAPAWYLVPDDWIRWGLGFAYSPAVYDLSDPRLLQSWRAIVATVAGLLVVLVFALLIALARWSRRRRETAALPEPVKRWRAAVRKGDAEAMRSAADELGETQGADAVPELVDALKKTEDDETRRRLAAALYRIGRAETAEVALHPRR